MGFRKGFPTMPEMSLEEAPRKAREHFEKGVAAMERNNFDYAMDMFDSALELAPALLRARKYLRVASIRKQKLGKVSGLTHAMSSLTGMGAVFQAQGLIKKKPAEAVKAVEKLLRKDPLNLQFINLMVEAARAASMPEVALLTLEVAKENYANNIDILQTLGRLYQDENRMHDARLVYEELARLKPNEPQFIKLLKDATALDSMQRGQWDDQSTDFRSKLKNKSESVQLERQAKAVQSDRDLDVLIAETQMKITRDPNNTNYQRALADYLTKANRLEEAMEVLLKAQEKSGGTDPQLERQITALNVRRFDEAIAEHEKAGDAAGVAELRTQKTAYLMDDAEDRVKRYPNDLQFKYELGVLYYEAGRHLEAIQQFQKSKSNPQRRLRSLYYMALCFKAKGQHDLAIEQLEGANSELSLMDDTKMDIIYELGSICEAIGQADRAADYYKQIYAVDISYRDVAQKIEKSYKKD
jgi:tetratricopeptide (TPR) repeat protein